jgi:uncharacterized protein YecT (DUF1311 family)
VADWSDILKMGVDMQSIFWLTFAGLMGCIGNAVAADDGPFDEQILKQAFELSKTCSKKCGNDSFGMVRLPVQGNAAFLIGTNDREYCGSGGCASLVVVVSGSKFLKIKEGQGITENQAISVVSGAGDSDALLDRKPSFDCSKASSASARLICGDPDLSKADSLLGTKFRAAADTNQAARRQLVEQQIIWIRARNSRCGVGPDKAKVALEQLRAAKPCMLEAINARIAEVGADKPPSNAAGGTAVEKLHVIANTTPPDAFVSLRTDPSTQVGQRLATMPNGTVVKVLQQKPDGWWKVRIVATGQEGWSLSGQNGKTWITPSEQDQAATPNAPSKSSRGAVVAALRRYHGDKIILRRGNGLDGYAVYSWTDPVSSTGGETLLKYDADKSAWIMLDTDGGGLDVQRLIAKGVPQRIADQLISRQANVIAQAQSAPPVRKPEGGLSVFEPLTWDMNCNTTTFTIKLKSNDLGVLLDSSKVRTLLEEVRAINIQKCWNGQISEFIRALLLIYDPTSRPIFAADMSATGWNIRGNAVQNDAAAQRLADARRSAQERMRTEFGVQQFVRIDDLRANPFLFRDKVISTLVRFSMMTGESEAIFRTDNYLETPMLYASKVPPTLFQRNQQVVLALRVIGINKETSLPHVEFIGAHFCSQPECQDYFTQ